MSRRRWLVWFWSRATRRDGSERAARQLDGDPGGCGGGPIALVRAQLQDRPIHLIDTGKIIGAVESVDLDDDKLSEDFDTSNHYVVVCG